MSIPVMVNRCAAFLVPIAKSEAQAAMSGFIKAVARYGPGGRFFRGDASMFLTQAEEAALFQGARRFVISSGETLFLVGALLDTIRNVISPGEERRTVATRLEMIQAQLTKGGPILTRALAVGEQVLFIVTDISGVAVGDIVAGTFETVDLPGATEALPFIPGTNGYYAELLPLVDDVSKVDSVIDAPGLVLWPRLLPLPQPPAITAPLGPKPSWGRRR